mmetsp:Transcript_37679/g.82549  ORF Transcript_37679/g.82549 Transcript_37679/m.82549 type:complete len:1014 (-) Transcript_37679:79-3120(-)|eukprot:CAMPEP_0178515176 /NCGR_PEP_ID=MMETSP0696-20121128/24418_1 /TAXON_ID=265572 /ORGANISM="Extubocellulus spinifer, Strain CCMP396" /LENGTH=1013 /DNA_ID=CAMNT_0020145323 /DNA_START=59 /DNA_END=3100 /DNA_ORIENTATION=+
MAPVLAVMTACCASSAAAVSAAASSAAQAAAGFCSIPPSIPFARTICRTGTGSSSNISSRSRSGKFGVALSPVSSLSSDKFGVRKTFPLFSSLDEARASSPPTGAKIDESEWQAVIAALQMYNAAYGDLKVPSRFVVPSLPPWPEVAWGLKLGQRVASIRSTGKYVQDDNDRRQTLDDMGFLWRLRAQSREGTMDGITFDQVFEALQKYREVIQPRGKINVPSNFVVPNADPWPESTRGMPLGKKMPAIRSKAYLKANPGAADRLAKLGFEFDGKAAANDQRYLKVLDALTRYKELNGDLLVPQPFVVPDGDKDWPEDTWGLRLGARVNAIRSQGTFVKTNPVRRQELDELGFEWELPAEGKKRGRKKKVENEALQGPAPPGMLDGGLQGDSASDSAEDGASTYGDALFPFPDQKENKPLVWGFEDEDEEDANQAVMDAIPVEKDLNATLEEAIAVAKSVGIVRGVDNENRILKGKRERDCPWYIDDFGDGFVFDDVVEALTIYRDMMGNFNGLSDEDFAVPDSSEALFGGKSSAAFDAESSAAAAAAIAAAERGEGGDSEALIAAEIERLERDIQSSLSTDDDDDGGDEDGMIDEMVDGKTSAIVEPTITWPEHLSGMPLGNIVRRIRDGSLEVKHLRERKRRLDAIGFDWGDPKKFLDVPFEKAMCAMLAYYQIRGDMMVTADFVIPGEVPWPQALAGYELGRTVVRIRELQNFFEAYHTDKVALLKMVDFYWFPDVALPLDPFSWGETTEDEFLSAVGVPFYWLGEEQNYPPGLVENIMADGPTDNPDPTVKWYNYDHVRDYWESDAGTEVIQFFDDKFGANLPAETLWRFGLPKLAREQEARYAAGKLGEIARERLDLEKAEDNLLRPILKSMSDIQTLKEDYDGLSDRLKTGEIDREKFEKEKVPIEWKVEDIISRLKGTTEDFEGGARGEGERVIEKRKNFSVKEAAYEKEVESNWNKYDEVVKEKFPNYDPEHPLPQWDPRLLRAQPIENDEFGENNDEGSIDDET